MLKFLLRDDFVQSDDKKEKKTCTLFLIFAIFPELFVINLCKSTAVIHNQIRIIYFSSKSTLDVNP